MAEFTASPDVSGFTPPNQLFNYANAVGAAQGLQSNQLGIQGKQIDLANANMAQVGQAAAGLLSAYPDEASRAAAYPKVVGMLQSQGVAMNAPQTYPGEGALRAIVNASIPAKDLYSSGVLTPPGLTDALARASAPPPGYGGAAAPGGVATTPSATIEPAAFNNATAVRDGLIKRGVDPDTATALAANALHESVANPRTGRGDNGNSAGLFQWAGPRLQAYTDTYGHSPDGSPLDEQLDNVVRELKGSEAPAAAKIAEAQGPAAKAAAVSQYYLRPKDTQGEMQRRSATALQLQQQIGGGTTTASAAPTTAQPGQPVPTQVAGPPMVSTAPAAPTAAPGAPAQPAAPSAATAQPSQPQPAAAPTASAQPGATPLPGTGVNSQQFQTALWKTQQAALLETQFPNSPQAKAKAAELRAEAALYMQADSVITLPNGIQVKALSGQQVDAAKPRPDWYFDPDAAGGVGAFVDRTGTNKPEVLPARRMSAQPNGDVINDQGKVIFHVDPVQLEKDAEGQYWYIPKYPTTRPDGTPVPPRPVGGNLPTPAFAEEQKVEAKRLSDLRTAVLDRAKESAQANTMIANTETALQEAQKGNLGAGALSPQKLQIVATAKALGINLAPFGIDSDKLAAAQVTREQLQQLNGAILRKMYPQRITNADLAISGTVLPNYGLDEQALTSNFDIYKKQNAYDTRMAQDMLAYQDQHHTLVGWENQWHAKNGFGAGPIDNLFGDAQAGRLTSGGTKAGGGNQPPQQAVALPPIESRVKGKTYPTARGEMMWTGTGWAPPEGQ